MLKLRKLSLILSLLLVLSFFVATPVFAATLISSYSCGLCDSGTLRVSWSASTVCTTYVDYGTLTVRLQYLDNGTWTNVATIYHTGKDQIVISDAGNLYVSSAGLYRLQTIHFVQDGPDVQSKTSTSPTVSVN